MRLRGAQLAAVAAAWRALGEDAQALLRLHPAQRKALDAGSYPAWRAVGQAASTRRGARGRPRRAAGVRQARRLPRAARSLPSRRGTARSCAGRSSPTSPSSRPTGTAYSCNPRAIYEKARELAPGMRGVWVVDADKRTGCPPGCRSSSRAPASTTGVLARATYLVNNVNFPNDLVKRPGQVHVQTHHGTPLKTMGLDLVDADVRPQADELRPAAARGSPSGTSASRRTRSPPSVGAGLPGDVREPRDRLPAQRRAGGRDRRAGRGGARRARHRRGRPRSSTRRRTASTTRASCRSSTRRGWRRRSGRTTCCSARPLLLRRLAARGPSRRRASSTSPTTRGSRTCASRPTCWSRTTRRSCSTTPCSTGRS